MKTTVSSECVRMHARTLVRSSYLMRKKNIINPPVLPKSHPVFHISLLHSLWYALILKSGKKNTYTLLSSYFLLLLSRSLTHHLGITRNLSGQVLGHKSAQYWCCICTNYDLLAATVQKIRLENPILVKTLHIYIDVHMCLCPESAARR